MTKTSYQEWTEEVLNTHLRLSTSHQHAKLVSTPERGCGVKPQYAQSVIKFPQYIILVGQHLVVNNVVLWLTNMIGGHFN